MKSYSRAHESRCRGLSIVCAMLIKCIFKSKKLEKIEIMMQDRLLYTKQNTKIDVWYEQTHRK